MLQLYTYYRSVSAHRVRIALNIKGIPYKSIFIDEAAGEQYTAEYTRLNPWGLIPALVVNPDMIVTQSAAIIEYLEERYPERPLLPKDINGRARVRSFAQACIADIQPMNVLRVYDYLRNEMKVDHATRRRWYEHWAHKGFRALESLVATHGETGDFCHGDAPTLADVCLVPQMYNAERNKLDLSQYVTLRRIYRTCQSIPAFQAAAPQAQPDLIAKSV
jgi:maleylacetoacetate isomerase